MREKEKKMKNTDKLDDIFKNQYDLQKYLGTFEKFNSSEAMRQQYINQMILAIHEEAVEIMKESAYKNPDYVPFGWKKGQEFNKDKFKEEIVDIIHFIVNLCISVNMTSDELYNRYMKKNQENYKRKDKGY